MKKLKQIKWREGNSILVLGTFAIVLVVFFGLLIAQLSQNLYLDIVCTTRADAIADSTALYAQSYDYQYNKSQAEIMSEIMTDANNDNSNYHIVTEIDFIDDNTLAVYCEAETERFVQLNGVDPTISSSTITEVRSVDPYGKGIIIVK